MFSVRPWYITAGAVKKAADDGFSIFGTGPISGHERQEAVSVASFTGKREFIAVISLTYEGEL